MTRYYHGKKKKYPYFEGWYLKHQAEGRMIAFIPAIHADEQGKWTASIQMITEEGSWCFSYPASQCTIERRRFRVMIGENLFTEKGIWVNLKNKDVSVYGNISYGPFAKLKKDIMGPFKRVPFLECNHGVLSMMHRTRGGLLINGREVDLDEGLGYIETDWGSSFPKEYLWTQCIFTEKKKGSLMLSVADVPIGRWCFRGCICQIEVPGRTYRLATYLGAKVRRLSASEAVVRQGKLCLKVTKLGERSYGLSAPRQGSMTRIIRESPVCRIRYQLWEKGSQIFDIVDNHASFEYVKDAKR